MDLIKYIFEVITRGKLEYRLAILFFLVLINITGSENVAGLLESFSKNEIFGFIFIRQLWAVYSLFFMGVTAFLLGRVNLHFSFPQVDHLEDRDADCQRTLRQVTLIRDVIYDLIKGLTSLFLSTLFSFSILLDSFGIRINSSMAIILVITIAILVTTEPIKKCAKIKVSEKGKEINADME